MSNVVSDLMNTIDELNIKNKDLERQLEEAREIQNQLCEWVYQYIHCMRTVDYCGSLEDANEMRQYLDQLKVHPNDDWVSSRLNNSQSALDKVKDKLRKSED